MYYNEQELKCGIRFLESMKYRSLNKTDHNNNQRKKLSTVKKISLRDEFEIIDHAHAKGSLPNARWGQINCEIEQISAKGAVKGAKSYKLNLPKSNYSFVMLD